MKVLDEDNNVIKSEPVLITVYKEYYRRAKILEEVKLEQQALNSSKKIDETHLQRAMFHSDQGNELAFSDDQEGALRCYYLAIKIDPNQAIFHLGVAIASASLDNYQNAWNAYFNLNF